MPNQPPTFDATIQRLRREVALIRSKISSLINDREELAARKRSILLKQERKPHPMDWVALEDELDMIKFRLRVVLEEIDKAYIELANKQSVLNVVDAWAGPPGTTRPV
ncbi:hypothetical protein VHEMI06399 [[Torrubiella] hemipterigena]|uniref:Uncharacterized protein n=1 Tax=[Torrubiella] hemipterigena TaxID=1531966 RepID=A0A0A1T0H6_9HYPO|nr:hypothetical protein VHEMI06399 [[Torrubiella] hemipterigena]